MGKLTFFQKAIYYLASLILHSNSFLPIHTLPHHHVLRHQSILFTSGNEHPSMPRKEFQACYLHIDLFLPVWLHHNFLSSTHASASPSSSTPTTPAPGCAPATPTPWSAPAPASRRETSPAATSVSSTSPTTSWAETGRTHLALLSETSHPSEP